MKQRKYKLCPRCDHRVPFFEDRCDSCGLIFSRLKKATNSAAKNYIKKGQNKNVIMDKVLPCDVNKWKMFFLALFFGWFGVHYAKVGRYKMFTWAVLSMALLVIASFLPKEWLYEDYLFILMWLLILPSSLYVIFNIVSIFEILFNNFKVPIAIDETLVVEDLDKKVVDDILLSLNDNKKSDANKNKRKKVTLVCASCGMVVKVFEDEEICPKCEEQLKNN